MIVAFGASLNVWTTRHGALVANATLVQVDRDADAIGAHRPVDHGLVGDARETAEALIAALNARDPLHRPRRSRGAASRWPRRSPAAPGATSPTSRRASGSTRAT